MAAGKNGSASPEDTSRGQDSIHRAGLDRDSVLEGWRPRLARVRLSSGSRPTSGAFSNVEESALRVRKALQQIVDPTDRAILVLRLFRGKTVPEVARRLGIGEAEVTERYRKGLRRMEEDLGEWLKTSRRPE